MSSIPLLDTLRVDQLLFDAKNPRLPVNYHVDDEDKGIGLLHPQSQLDGTYCLYWRKRFL